MSDTTTTATGASRAAGATARARGIRSPRAAARPGMLRVGASRIGYETKGYFRSPDAVFFTFLFPLIMLGIFTAAFSSAGDIQPGPGAEGVSVGAYYLPGMLAAGMLLSGVQNLAVDIAEREGRRHAQAPRRHAAVPRVVLHRQDRTGLRDRRAPGGAPAPRRRDGASASRCPPPPRPG